MEQQASSASDMPIKRPWVLRVFTLIYAVLYLIAFISEAFPLQVKDIAHLSEILLFVFFIICYVFSWFRERTAGYLFISWYLFQVFVGNFFWNDDEMAMTLTFPVLLLGIFFLLYSNRENRDPQPSLKEQWRLFLRISIFSGLVIHIITVADNLFTLHPAEWIHGPYLSLHLLFIVYVVGFILSERHELVTGILLTAYYLAIIFLLQMNVFEGMAPYGILTFPVLALGLLYMLYAVKEKQKRVTGSSESDDA